MSDTAYDVGALVRASGVFTNSAGVATDPAAVLFAFKTPAGVETIYAYGTDVELVKDSVGNYHVDINATVTGIWYYRFYSTGSGQSADEEHFTVNDTEF